MSSDDRHSGETGNPPRSARDALRAATGSPAVAAGAVVGATLTAAAVWWFPPGPSRQGPVFLLLWIWPALTWALLLHGTPAFRLLSGSALAILLNALFALALHHVPGPLSRPALLVAAVVTTIAPAVWANRPASTRRDQGPGRTTWKLTRSRFIVAAALIVILALALRLPGLGYKEFQGDEGVIMVRAAAALEGDDAELFLHQKGPVEILIPLFTWRLTESIDEFWARLPFTWAAWLGVGTLILLTRRWFNRRAALAAGLLYAVGGFGVAFARIVQYQSLVVLWGLASLLHATRYYRRCPRRASDLLLAAVFLAGGLLAHYDAILVAPAVAALIFPALYAAHRQRRKALANLALSAAVAAAILALFYAPYVLNPTFSGTAGYLLQDRLGGNLLSWSLPQVWQMATFYNSLYYVVGLLLLLLAAAVVGFGRLRRRPAGIAVTAGAALYLGVPLLFYSLVVADPRTHVYTIFPGAAVLAGAGAGALWRRAGTSGLRAVAGATFLALVTVSTLYVALLFIDATPERQRTWSDNRPGGFPTTWETPPRYGLFGFPYQAGWRLVPELVDGWPYASNEEREVTDWYMAHAPRTHCPNFETFILAESVQDPVPFDDALLDALHLHDLITVKGRPALRIYRRRPVEAVASHEAAGARLWRTVEEMIPPERTGSHPVGVTLGDKVHLLGYDLDTAGAHPGGAVVVTLYWQALAPFDRNFQAFAHLYHGDSVLAQHDSAPECAVNPTTRWEPGDVVADPHVITLPAHLPGAEAPLFIGMYDLITEERLPVPGAGDNLIYLTDVSLDRGGQ